MALHDDVAKLSKKTQLPEELQGVSKAKIREVLGQLDLANNPDIIDAVFALLDDQTDSWFSKPPEGAKICDGATTAHLACHIGIFQRGGTKLDREGRDYWIKPLRQLGGIEPMTLHDGEFIAGHVKAKSPNSCYRLDRGLAEVLRAGAGAWPEMLEKWASEDAARVRQQFQAQAAEAAHLSVDHGHSDLIHASINTYAKHFLPGYQVVYVDDGDGDRITEADRERFKNAGVDIRLEDGMPDVLLWNPATNRLWVIEAVTSDGEADLHKVTQLKKLAERSGKKGIDFTTTYRTWKELATRQAAHQNISVDTYIWIQGDPSKHLHVLSFSRASA